MLGATTAHYVGETQGSVRKRRSSVSLNYVKFNWDRESFWLLFSDPLSSVGARLYGIFMMLIITISTMTFVLETETSVKAVMGGVFAVSEVLCISCFTFDLAIRGLLCPTKKAFVKDYFNWVDLVAVLPYYLERAAPVAINGGGFGIVRVVRLVRVFRVMKVSRYSTAVRMFSKALSTSAHPLFTMLFLVSIGMILFSSAMYYAESTLDNCRLSSWVNTGSGGEACSVGNGYSQIDHTSRFTRVAGDGSTAVVSCTCLTPNPFPSIPAAFWWCIVTMTTVGYGDMFPVTSFGKLIASLTMLSGVLVFALPITVIGTKFTNIVRDIEKETAKKQELEYVGEAMSSRSTIASGLNNHHRVAPKDCLVGQGKPKEAVEDDAQSLDSSRSAYESNELSVPDLRDRVLPVAADIRKRAANPSVDSSFQKEVLARLDALEKRVDDQFAEIKQLLLAGKSSKVLTA